jgi:hypothetical protein
MYECEVPAFSGDGVIVSMSSGVGSHLGAGLGGWNITTLAGIPIFKLDDGTNPVTINSGVSINDGVKKTRIVVTRVAGVSASIAIYNAATGALLGSQSGSDLTVKARGSLTNVAGGFTVGRHPDTTTGRMNAAFGLSLSHFERSASAAMLPMPYVATAPDGWQYSAGTMVPYPTQDANSPYTVFGANLKLLTLESGYTVRSKLGSLTNPNPQSPTTGWPCFGIMDYSTGNEWCHNTDGGTYVNDALVGQCRHFIQGITQGFDLSTAAGRYDFIQNARQFTVEVVFKAEAAAAASGYVISTFDATFTNGFYFRLDHLTSGTFGITFTIGNSSSYFYDQSIADGGPLPNITPGHWYSLIATGPTTVAGGKMSYYVTDLTASGSTKSGNNLTPLITPSLINSTASAFVGVGVGTADKVLTALNIANGQGGAYQGWIKRISIANRNITAAEAKQLTNYVGP